MIAGAAAAATFVLSGLLMAQTVHRPEHAERERTVMADFDVIRRRAEGKTIAVLTRMRTGPNYYLRGAVQMEMDKGHLADFVVSDRIGGVRSLTPDNRSRSLYDRSAFLARYERRADARHPVLRSPDYDVHFIRNEGGGDELLYFRRECPAAVRRWPNFFLHVRPVDANDLPADRRRHGFENRDFHVMDTGMRFWRRDGKCYVVRPLPDYGVAGVRTGQFTIHRTREGVRYEHVWAGSFSPDDFDGAAAGAPPR